MADDLVPCTRLSFVVALVFSLEVKRFCGVFSDLLQAVLTSETLQSLLRHQLFF